MKIKLDIDCSPTEARAFLGLPDVGPLNEALVARLKVAAEEGLKPADIEAMVKNWIPAMTQGMSEGMAQWQRAFFAGMGDKTSYKTKS